MPSQSERRLVFALQVIAKNLGCDLAAGHKPSSERSRSQKTRPNGCRYLPTSQLRTRFTTLLAQWRLHHRCRASTNPRNGYRQCLEPYRKRSEEHTSELQSPDHLVCRLLLEKKNKETRIM